MPDEPWVDDAAAVDQPDAVVDPDEEADVLDDADDADDEGAGNGKPKRRGKVKKRHTVARVLAVTTLALAMVTGLTVVYSFRHLSGNLNVADYSQDLQNRPEKKKVEGPKEPLNILIMGTDTRQGEGNNIDNQAGEGGSDTTILVHLSADREHAYGISIPRDSMVDRPACDKGAIPAASYQMWNAAFAIGGPACTIQQFEQLTGILVDHYVTVDFNGFQEMVDAVGGVEVCIPETIDDRSHGIYLEAGTREISGRQALSYVRQRYAVGDGSDIGRLKRQQAFVASMSNKVLSAGTLTSPTRLLGFLNAATKSLTVDPGLSNMGKIAKLGIEFRNINPSNIQFLTIPWTVDPSNPNRVWAPEAKVVWRRIALDKPLTRRLTVDAISAARPPDGQEKTKNKKNKNGSASASPSATPTDQADQAAAAAGLCT
ncbi:LCP family protein [Nocardioides sp.]|uniref:LCP family protein n=1 Tax=Nocardioides sp. TaxID=35761 RepID=UPI003526D4D0